MDQLLPSGPPSPGAALPRPALRGLVPATPADCRPPCFPSLPSSQPQPPGTGMGTGTGREAGVRRQVGQPARPVVLHPRRGHVPPAAEGQTHARLRPAGGHAHLFLEKLVCGQEEGHRRQSEAVERDVPQLLAPQVLRPESPLASPRAPRGHGARAREESLAATCWDFEQALDAAARRRLMLSASERVAAPEPPSG